MDLISRAKLWCWGNGIKIYPNPILSDGSVLMIIVSRNGNEELGKSKYTNSTVYDKINELYIEIYNKYHDKVIN